MIRTGALAGFCRAFTTGRRQTRRQTRQICAARSPVPPGENGFTRVSVMIATVSGLLYHANPCEVLLARPAGTAQSENCPGWDWFGIERGRRCGRVGSAAVVVRPVRRASSGNGVVEYPVLVSRACGAILAGRAAIPFPGAEQELVRPAAVAGSPRVAAALFGVANADSERRMGSVTTRWRRR